MCDANSRKCSPIGTGRVTIVSLLVGRRHVVLGVTGRNNVEMLRSFFDSTRDVFISFSQSSHFAFGLFNISIRNIPTEFVTFFNLIVVCNYVVDFQRIYLFHLNFNLRGATEILNTA